MKISSPQNEEPFEIFLFEAAMEKPHTTNDQAKKKKKSIFKILKKNTMPSKNGNK